MGTTGVDGKRSLNSIQASRAVAAWLVAIGHALAYAGVVAGPENAGIASLNWFTPTLGQSGVDVFFVISGIIMVMVIRRSEGHGLSEVGKFLWRRLIRIYPLYWVTMPIGAAIAVTIPFEWENLAKYVALVNQPNSFPIAWTLVYEVRFYLIIAPALFFTGIWRAASMVCSFSAIVGVVGADALGIKLSPEHGDPILLEFVMGGIVGYLITSGIRAAGKASLVLGLAGFGIACIVLSPAVGVSLFYRFIGFGLTAAFVLYGLASLELSNKLRIPQLLVVAGNQSYSVYLWHWVVVTGLYYNWPVHHYDGRGALLFFVASLSLSAMAAFLSYHLIEKPTSTGWRRLKPPNQSPALQAE